jgi:hypothetical protein
VLKNIVVVSDDNDLRIEDNSEVLNTKELEDTFQKALRGVIDAI